MRSGPIALRAAGAAAVLVLAPTAGAAYAHDGVKVTVIPSTVRPGTDVAIRVQGCESKAGAAKSKAFVADAELTGRGGVDSRLVGGTTVKSKLGDGTYKVAVTCDGHDHRDVGTIRVQRHEPTHQPTHKPTHQPTHKPTHQPTHKPTHQPTHHASPVAPVRAGGGGAAVFAAPVAPGVAQTVTDDGLGTPYTLVGLGLAAAAAVAVAFRSARRHRTGSVPDAD
ncbi:PT domain-containing protein [Streptomyces sp. NPDC006551]|uniref:PT domain-containing protein n=1 Tax=Streptomyces sp. NPDC006551 TaxID=3157178 RepID=UPI0033A26832